MKQLVVNFTDEQLNTPGAVCYHMGLIAGAIDTGEVESIKRAPVKWKLI